MTMVDMTAAAERGREGSSRVSEEGAGWACSEVGTFVQLGPRRKSFSWFHPLTLWRSRNEIVAKLFGDPSPRVRRAWVEGQRRLGVDAGFRIEPVPGKEEFSFLLLGDPGEGDASQYAVVPGMLKIGEGTSFAVVASDVVYPAGAPSDYEDNFFRPYQDYPSPIYAVPGNHDWYDGLGGFMRVFCGAPPLAAGHHRVGAPLQRLLWRKPERIDEARLAEAAKRRGAPGQRAAQPGPYWVMDTPNLLIVGVDTGIGGCIDAEQGTWLREVSRDPRPKILVTGKPIYSRNRYEPSPIEGGGTIDDIVRDPACNYVAAIGGDIHNYQHYPVKVADRTIHYLVAGGSGAFTHATHTMGRVEVGGVHEDDFRCYPLRGDSLSFYSRIYSRRFGMRRLYLTPAEAAAITHEHIGNTPVRQPDANVAITRRMRWAARLLGVGRLPFPLRLPVGRVFHRYLSELSDVDDPPFFKSFLHVDVSRDTVRIRCFAATGCRAQEVDPPLEDEVVIELPPRRGGVGPAGAVPLPRARQDDTPPAPGEAGAEREEAGAGEAV
ncbi:Calcineurin-like phosphoesterase [Sinosporangium album]|uniref:Calcineurin-like phosphoesterase n=1 Tax=Sinosporangium album TaxID=504805 RepID=A0A1G8BPS3_9ACTN|nr:metallophosphoesterase [Sinosporangium album]SDH35227.1 Calcineurin-like phosphoesterase [Sinosporangium album]